MHAQISRGFSWSSPCSPRRAWFRSSRSPGARRAASKAKPYTTWTAYGGGPHSAQFTALTQINKTNVSQLQVAWTYPVTGTIVFNPIVVDDVMYVQGTGNAIVALDAATGKEMWRHAEPGRASAPAASTTGRARTARIAG